ncbi:MAG: hypothetical protein ACTSQJ_02555 [Promethearchaeota archaeon]
MSKQIQKGKAHWVRSIENTSGELEQETKSRKSNLIEAFLVMILILVDLWLIAYPAVLLGIEWLNILSIAILVVGAIIIILISPNIHKDEFTGWGLGNPKYLIEEIKNAEKSKQIILISIVGILISGLTAAAYIFWVEIADFLGINETQALQMKENIGGKIIIIGLGCLIAFLFATIVIRYDNFGTSLLTAFKIIIPLAILMIIVALILNGTKVFLTFNAGSFALNVFGYLFWGVIQQLLFSSYFGTRIRKGFAPAENSEDIKKKRFLVAFLNGAFFGLLHIPSWYLLAVTWFLGIFLSYVFMKDENRNLVALGFIHGTLGSMLGWLFSSSEAEGLNIEMSVGPWNINTFQIEIFIVVGIIIAFFIMATIYVYFKWED